MEVFGASGKKRFSQRAIDSRLIHAVIDNQMAKVTLTRAKDVQTGACPSPYPATQLAHLDC